MSFARGYADAWAGREKQSVDDEEYDRGYEEGLRHRARGDAKDRQPAGRPTHDAMGPLGRRVVT